MDESKDASAPFLDEVQGTNPMEFVPVTPSQVFGIKTDTKLKVVLANGARYIGTLVAVRLYWRGVEDAPEHPAETAMILRDDSYGTTVVRCDTIQALYTVRSDQESGTMVT